MGGAYLGFGNTTPTAEFNILADPEAAKIAFSSFRDAAIRPMAIGIDVTHQVRLLSDQIADLARLSDDHLEVRSGSNSWGEPRNPLLHYLEGALRKYAEYHEKAHGFYGIYLHDPLTVACAVDPAIIATKPVSVDVECQGSLTSGETVADWQNLWEIKPNLDVAVSIDIAHARQAVIRGVSEGLVFMQSRQ
jgi:purine nucleosidase